MIVLGIETSCDESAASIVKDGRTVLSSHVSSQIEVHREFGGVVPEIAAREHLRVLDLIVGRTLRDAGMTPADVDLIAVTQGPGLIGALLVGVAYAKGLAMTSGKPLIPVDHVRGHIFGALLGLTAEPSELYPGLALVVSGGHTNLYFMRGPTEFAILANAIDDACGECFDKVAKLLGLAYPGGPVIEKLAAGGDAKRFPMPRMVERKEQMEFSYSGLKTHMVNLYQSLGEAPASQDVADLCASFQEEALGQLVRKVQQALKTQPEARSLLVAGGVAANQRFRDMVAQSLKVRAFFPALKYCSDNAAMIAAYGYFSYKNQFGESSASIPKSWDAYSRYQF